MYSIAVIAVPASLNNILKIGEQLQAYCNVTFLSYTSKENLVYTYKQNIDRFDGFLFGGPYTYHLLLECISEIEKPFSFFNIEDRDYYRMIAELAIEHPGIDFSRVYIDEPGIHVDFDAIFHAPGIPPQIPDDYPEDQYEEVWNNSLMQYQNLWNSKKADLIITRFGSMVDELNTQKIAYKLLLPSKDTMMNTFWGLIGKLKEQDLQASLTSIGIVAPLAEDHAIPDNGEKIQLLKQSVRQFNSSTGDLFLVSENNGRIELTTSSVTLREETRRFSFCPLLRHLERTLAFPISIGWGCGMDVMKAYKNAEHALLAASRHSSFASYAMTEEEILIGPLAASPISENMPIISGTAPSESFFRGISGKNKKLVLALIRNQAEPVLSAAELAAALKITVRSAARILKAFEDSGAAQSFYRKNRTTVGRPIKYYRFDPHILPDDC